MNLDGYYQDHLKHMRGACSDDAWFSYKLPILAALTSTRKSVSIDFIQKKTKIKERVRIRKILIEWGQFLRTQSKTLENRPGKFYSLYHSSFHRFVFDLEEVSDQRFDLGIS